MSEHQCNCGTKVVNNVTSNTGTYSAKISDENTLERMVSNLRTLENSIDRLESAIDRLEAGSGTDSILRESTPLKDSSVVNMWKSTPSRLYDTAERVYKLIDRLEELFR